MTDKLVTLLNELVFEQLHELIHVLLFYAEVLKDLFNVRKRKYLVLDVRDFFRSPRSTILLQLSNQLINMIVIVLLYLEYLTVTRGCLAVVMSFLPDGLHFLLRGPKAIT